MTFWKRAWAGPIVILLAGLCVQQLVAFAGQYTVHSGYIDRKLRISEKGGIGRGYYRNRIDIPAEYGRFITNVTVNRWPMLWYQSADGRIRNVEVHEDFAAPLVIERTSHSTRP